MALASRISVVTPTLARPRDVRELLANLAAQTALPCEVILVDGAPAEDDRTRDVVDELAPQLPWPCRYLRHGGGTAIQRNVGIEASGGDFVAFIDDDMRLREDYFERMLEVFAGDRECRIGGVAGYITNQFLDPAKSPRWRWYRRLGLFTTYEPGRYDYQSGYPINRYLQPPHDGLREVDFMSTNNAVWRHQVFAGGLRFSEFFIGYGVLEDAHFALRAGRRWTLLECGRARCQHLRSPHGRVNSRAIARMSAVNYRFVFIDLVPRRSLSQELRFWRVQLLDLLRFCFAFLRRWDRDSLALVTGKLEGIWQAAHLKASETAGSKSSSRDSTSS